jgi:hypothetical protein
LIVGGEAVRVSIVSEGFQITTGPRTAESAARRLGGRARLEIASGMRPRLEAAGIRSLGDALDPGIGARVAGSRSSWVRRVPAGPRALYVKCFVYPTAKDVLLRIVSRRFLWHRARREWRSIALQQELGLPVAERVCLGELRRLGILRASVLVTDEIEGVRRLDEWLHDEAAGGRPGIESAAIVARYAVLLHGRGFVHGDLNARNVLLRAHMDGPVQVFNVDSARGRRHPWRGRLTPSHLGDLAPLVIAFRVLLGRGAARSLVGSYAAGLGIALTEAVERRLEAEISRIGAKEARRLEETGPTGREQRGWARARADSERDAP